MRSQPSQPASQPPGLGPDFLEANQTGPAPGRFAPMPAPSPGQANPDPPGPDLTAAAAGGEAAGDSGSSEPRPWAIPTPVKDIRSGPFETVARGLLRALGGLVNNRTQAHPDDASFIPDDEDERMFAPAAGRIAARHMPLPDKADMSELEDIGVAVVALLNWAGKGLISAWDARAEKRRARQILRGAGTSVHEGQEGDQQ